MLTGLLPGLRDLRSPLAAGYLLLLACWLVLEPQVPDRSEAEGVLTALYRLSGVFSVLGVAVAISFVAYIAGSLSVLLFNGALRAAIRPSPTTGRWRDPITPGSRAAIELISIDALSRVRATLALSGHDVDEVLAPTRRAPKQHVGGEARRRRSGPGRAPSLVRSGPGDAQPEGEPTVRWLGALQELVRNDLAMVATTRLLGEKPDLFSALDRHRSEVEFRLAVGPPLALLAMAAAVRQDGSLVSLAFVGAGSMVALALFVDAVRQQRTANELIVDLLSTGVVKAPALERVEDRAHALAGAEDLAFRAVAERVDDAVKHALRDLTLVGTSEPTLANAAVRSAGEARRAGEAFREEFPDPAPFPALERCVDLLERAAAAWSAVNRGRADELPDDDRRDPQELVASARGAHLEFVRLVRDALVRLSERPSSGGSRLL